MTTWSLILAAAAIENDALRLALADVEGTQLRLLRAIIAANINTTFGKQQAFSKLLSVADFRAAVPIRNYDEMRSWVNELAEGASNVLTSDPVIAWEETGGSSGGRKLIPYTASSLKSFRAAVLPSLADLVQRRPRVAIGKLYAAISPATRQPRVLGNGVPLGLPDAAYLGEDVMPAFANLLAVPPKVGEITDVQTWYTETLCHLKSCNDLSFVSVWSPSFWLELCKTIGPDEVRDLWPNLDTISCWTHGTSSAFMPALQAAFPGVHIESKGLLSTEGAVTLAYGAEDGCIPALRSCFFEWIDEAGDVRLTHELEPDNRYRAVITTPGGLYRYDTRDVVLCVSRESNVPRLVFQGRAGVVSDMVGEKLDDAFAASILAQLPVPSRLVARNFPTAHYELWLDVSDNSNTAAWMDTVEKALSVNPQYAYARRMGQLKPLVAYCKPGFWNAFDKKNARLGVLKSAALLGLQPQVFAPKVKT
jgi:hypothetical protein